MVDLAVSAGLTVFLSAGMAFALVTVFGRRFGHLPTEITSIVSTACNAVMSLFVVTLAFLLVTAATDLGISRNNTFTEAGALRDVYWDANELPAPERIAVQRAVSQYTVDVIYREWPMMADGQTDQVTWSVLDQARVLVSADLAADPAGPGPVDTAAALDRVYRARRVREAEVSDGIAPIMLASLFMLALLALSCLMLAGWPVGWRYSALFSIVAGVMAMGMWLIIQLDHPYGGTIKVDPTAFQSTLEHLGKIP